MGDQKASTFDMEGRDLLSLGTAKRVVAFIHSFLSLILSFARFLILCQPPQVKDLVTKSAHIWMAFFLTVT